MAARNIGNVVDPFFRYKMPDLVISHEGKGRRTLLVNLAQIAKSLKRSEMCILHFLKLTLSTASHVKKEGKVIKYSLAGEFSKADLTTALDEFVDEFVTCDECGNPETELEIGGDVCKDCKACGSCCRVANGKMTEFLKRN